MVSERPTACRQTEMAVTDRNRQETKKPESAHIHNTYRRSLLYKYTPLIVSTRYPDTFDSSRQKYIVYIYIYIPRYNGCKSFFSFYVTTNFPYSLSSLRSSLRLSTLERERLDILVVFCESKDPLPTTFLRLTSTKTRIGEFDAIKSIRYRYFKGYVYSSTQRFFRSETDDS